MPNIDQIIRVPSDKMKSEFFRILLKLGFTDQDAEKCAEIFIMNSLDGVYSHGVNRFPRFIKTIKGGYVKPGASPTLTQRIGSIEQWNGNLGPGPLNAAFATDRAIELAAETGIGLVALSHTNHWMRGGTYGWQAAGKGCAFISWTNTCPNMPAWGAKDPRIGNNPLVFAVPFKNNAIVLDFAMSQYSYGKLETLNSEGKPLPYPGGYNKKGELTLVPGELLESWRVIPAGYWKGSGLSLLLDIMATILTGGLSTHQIGTCATESNVSQVFIAMNIRSLPNFPSIDDAIQRIINDLHNSIPVSESERIRYPGENIEKIRSTNLKEGIPVQKSLWDKIQSY